MDPHTKLSRRWLVALAPLLVAAGPPAPDTSLSAGMSLGRYTLLADEEPAAGALIVEDYRLVEVGADLSVEHRFAKGWTVAVSGSTAPGVPFVLGDAAAEPAVEQAYLWSGVSKVEAGYHGRFLGGQVGPAFLWRPETTGGLLVPTGALWVGKPEVLYVWGEGLPVPLTGLDTLFWAGGLGHRSRLVHAEVGTSGLAWVGRVGVRAGEGLWLRAELAGSGAADDTQQAPLRGRLGFTLEPQALQRRFAAPSGAADQR